MCRGPRVEETDAARVRLTLRMQLPAGYPDTEPPVATVLTSRYGRCTPVVAGSAAPRLAPASAQTCVHVAVLWLCACVCSQRVK